MNICSSKLNDDIQSLAVSLGADACGFANLRNVEEWITDQYGSEWADYSSAVSVSVDMPKDVVLDLLDGPTHAYLRYYDSVNARIDDICFRIANHLDHLGYRAYPIPASQMMSETKLAAAFSHRLAAREAGIGWIGKSCSILRPGRGPMHRLGTVLTNAQFVFGKPMPEQCGECHACADICPAHALKAVPFSSSSDRDDRFDAFACQAYLQQTRKTFGKQICGLCLAACPHGKNR